MLKFATIPLLTLATATPALAETVDSERGDDIVVTASGIEQPRDRVGVDDRDRLTDFVARRQSVDVVDLLATTPGVRFNRSGSTGSVASISLRGAETTQTLVLIDGVKVNDPSGIGDGYDFGHLLTGNIDRIEVLRGSNSVVHGSQAIGGAYFRTDGISSAAVGTEKDGYKNFAGNARLKVAFSDALSLDLRGYYINADLDYDSFFGAPADSADVAKLDQYVGYAGLNLGLFDGNFTSRAAVTWMRGERDYDFVRGTAPDYGYSGSNLRFEYQGVVTPVQQAKLIFGYEHERPDYDFFGFGSTDSQKADIDSVYALGIVQPVTGLSLSGGVRHDDHSQFGGATTFGANANYSPNAGATNFRLSYGEGFKAPSLYQLYDAFSGNAALRPERSKSYDIGVDQSLAEGRALISLTAFLRNTDDQINYDNATFTYGNIDRTRAKGVEATLALKPVDALNVTASYSYIDARDRSGRPAFDGKRLPRRAEHAVSLSADYDWSFGLSTGATLTMVGDSFDDFANNVPLDGYALAGIRASFPVSGHFEITGRVDNLFDADYATAFNYGTYGRAAYGGVRARF